MHLAAATFPGATGKKSRTPSMTSQNGLPTPKTPETPYSFQMHTPPPLPDSATSNYFSRTLSSVSPGAGGSSPRYTGQDGTSLGKKRSIIGALKSPSFTGVKSAMSDGWRRSSADAVSGQPYTSYRQEDLSSLPQPRHGSASSGTGMRPGLTFGLELPIDRSRSVSDQMPYSMASQRQTARDGLGSGFGEGLSLDDESMHTSTGPPSEYASARTSLDYHSVPPPALSASNTRPRNVKNLSLPLSNMHAVVEKLEESSLNTPSAEPFSANSVVLGTVAKGVRRKPVPQS
jgi:hypothetical protein